MLISPFAALMIVHVTGLALSVGAATLKLFLLLKCGRDYAFVPIYMKIVKVITRQIALGMGLLILSGVVWLVLGYPFTMRLAAKLILVAMISVSGALINRVEKKFESLAAFPEAAASAALVRVQRQYLALETTATLLFYIIIVVWAWG